MIENKPIIEFREFEKSYKDIHAVKALNLSVNAGETFALLGPNGSGKSTLIRALAGLHKPSSGKVIVNGQDINGKSHKAGNSIAYMPQRVALPGHLTARELLTFFAGLRGADADSVDSALDFVSLSQDADRYTMEFSGGMLQRLGLAVAFLVDVSIFILDEPTLNLDPVGVDCFRTKIKQLKERGTTIIFSSHILQDAIQLADRIGILVDGRLVGIETMSEFRDMLTQETVVRVVLETMSDKFADAALEAGAVTFSSNHRHYSFKASPARRLNIIRAIEHAGGTIEEFHTDPPDWETLIKQRFRDEGSVE